MAQPFLTGLLAGAALMFYWPKYLARRSSAAAAPGDSRKTPSAPRPASASVNEALIGADMSSWFVEKNEQWPGTAHALQVEQVLHSAQSEYQDVMVFKVRDLSLPSTLQCERRLLNCFPSHAPPPSPRPLATSWCWTACCNSPNGTRWRIKK